MSSEKGKGRTVSRGYGVKHRKAREELRPEVEAGGALCAELVCIVEQKGGTRELAPDAEWELAHGDSEDEYRGPAHPICNQTEAAKRGNAKRHHGEGDLGPVPEGGAAADQRIVGYDAEFPLSDLHPYYKNPRRGDIRTIRESLRQNGAYRALVVNIGTHTGRPHEVLAGNHTFAAAKAEKYETLAVTFVDVDEETAARIVVVDNRASDKATNDADVLRELLVDLDDLAGTGYTDEDLAKMSSLGAEEGEAEVDDVGEVQWGVIVSCEDESEQVDLLERLTDEGLTVRALMR